MPATPPASWRARRRAATSTTFVVLGLAVLTAGAAPASRPNDAAMLKLAAGSGCMTCHQVQAAGNATRGPDGLAPIGPAWTDVAAKYEGRTGAREELTRIVLKGSSPYESHWKGQVSGLAMPPNAVAVTPAEASRLVNWILGLPH